MLISDFSKMCYASKRMIRFYEELGILEPKRDINGYRIYNQADIKLVKKVILLNKAGLPLKDIALLKDCLCDKPQNFCSTLKGKLEVTRQDITSQINSLIQSKKLLDDLLMD